MLVLHRLRMENTNGNYRVYICITSVHGSKRKMKKEKNRI